MDQTTDSVERSPGWRWTTAALLVFLLAAASIYGEAWRRGPREFIPSTVIPSDQSYAAWKTVVGMDHYYVVWLVSRNAQTLITAPHRLFDAEHCFPAHHTLAFGEPLITMGVLGVLPYWLTKEPVLTYNVVVVAMALIGALAMFYLVSEWTACPPAGVVAALLYAFNSYQLQDPVHPYSTDSSWAVVAILFGWRLLAHGGWKNACALAAAMCLQLGTGSYAVVSAFLLACPLGIWLICAYGLRGRRALQLAAALAFAGLVAVLIFAPVLELKSAGALPARTFQIFNPLEAYLPGRPGFPGWPSLVLVAAALFLPARRSLRGISADPRWALLAAVILIVLVAAGPFASSVVGGIFELNLWRFLARVLPALESIRVPMAVCLGAYMAQAVLAGIGAAGLLSLWRWKGGLIPSVALILVVACSTLRPGLLGLERRQPYATYRIKPAPGLLEFFGELEAKGNMGPMLEWPIFMQQANKDVNWIVQSTNVFLSAYHHRRTSACYSSYVPPECRRVASIARRLPEREAVIELRRLGFTTIIVHHRAGGPVPANVFIRRADSSPDLLRRVHSSPVATAYEIVAGTDGATGSDQ
jgi:hypothetical protein